MGGVMARRTRHSATRVGSGTAEVKALEWHTVICGADHRPRAEQLIKPHLAVKDVAADQTEAALEIER
jgi:hypothetical protein